MALSNSYKWNIRHLPFYSWLMTLNVTSLRLGDTFTCVRIFLLLKLSNIALDGSAASSFPDIWGWTLELLPVWPCVAAMKNLDRYLLKPLFSVPLNAYPVAKVLDHTTKCFQVFEGLPWLHHFFLPKISEPQELVWLFIVPTEYANTYTSLPLTADFILFC